MLQVTINGQSHPFPEGLTINEALNQLDIEAPPLIQLNSTSDF